MALFDEYIVVFIMYVPLQCDGLLNGDLVYIYIYMAGCGFGWFGNSVLVVAGFPMMLVNL